MKILTIGVSTVNNNYISTISKLEKLLPLIDQRIDFIVINQNCESDFNEILNDRLTVFHTSQIGLSRSRNEILERAKCEWLWIQDDDIDLNITATNRLLDDLISSNGNVFLIKVGSLENKTEYYKNYAFHNRHHILNAMKISSIEIVVRTKSLNRVTFDSNLGLGTDLPCCEENLFLWQLFESLNGKGIQYYDHVLCYHTTNEDSRNIDHKKRMLAKGYFLSYIPIYFAIPLWLRWSIRAKETSFYESLTSMYNGFKRGR